MEEEGPNFGYAYGESDAATWNPALRPTSRVQSPYKPLQDEPQVGQQIPQLDPATWHNKWSHEAQSTDRDDPYTEKEEAAVSAATQDAHIDSSTLR